MEYDTREEQGKWIVALQGDVDLESSPTARRVLLDGVARGRDVLVDMSGVAYIDSSGVASLVEAFQNARKKGCGFGLASVSESALRVLQLARLDKVFNIHASVENGLSDDG